MLIETCRWTMRLRTPIKMSLCLNWTKWHQKGSAFQSQYFSNTSFTVHNFYRHWRNVLFCTRNGTELWLIVFFCNVTSTLLVFIIQCIQFTLLKSIPTTLKVLVSCTTLNTAPSSLSCEIEAAKKPKFSLNVDQTVEMDETHYSACSLSCYCGIWHQNAENPCRVW